MACGPLSARRRGEGRERVGCPESDSAIRKLLQLFRCAASEDRQRCTRAWRVEDWGNGWAQRSEILVEGHVDREAGASHQLTDQPGLSALYSTEVYESRVS